MNELNFKLHYFHKVDVDLHDLVELVRFMCVLTD